MISNDRRGYTGRGGPVPVSRQTAREWHLTSICRDESPEFRAESQREENK